MLLDFRFKRGWLLDVEIFLLVLGSGKISGLVVVGRNIMILFLFLFLGFDGCIFFLFFLGVVGLLFLLLLKDCFLVMGISWLLMVERFEVEEFESRCVFVVCFFRI